MCGCWIVRTFSNYSCFVYDKVVARGTAGGLRGVEVISSALCMIKLWHAVWQGD